MSSSKECFEFLKQHKMIPDSFEMKEKSSGSMDGVVLYKKLQDHEKQVFVKKYREGYSCDFNELYDYAIFTILKRCGLPAPKVKLKGTEKGHPVYFFANDIAGYNNKHPSRHYYYHDYAEAPYQINDNPFSIKAQDITFNNTTVATQVENYPINKIKLARMVLLGTILQMSDLHDGNFGFILNDENKTAKLAVIDVFSEDDEVEPKKYSNLCEFVQSYAGYNFDYAAAFLSLVRKLSEDDLIAGFEKIDSQFLSACKEIKDTINTMKFEPFYKITQMKNQIDQFKQTFLQLRTLVEQRKQARLGDVVMDTSETPVVSRCKMA